MAKKVVRKRTTRPVRRINAIHELVKQLRALDTEFRALDRLLRRTIRETPELRGLQRQLDRTREAVRIPAYGRLGPR